MRRVYEFKELDIIVFLGTLQRYLLYIILRICFHLVGNFNSISNEYDLSSSHLTVLPVDKKKTV